MSGCMPRSFARTRAATESSTPMRSWPCSGTAAMSGSGAMAGLASAFGCSCYETHWRPAGKKDEIRLNRTDVAASGLTGEGMA